MSADETSDRHRPTPPQDHHFQTPIVREQPAAPRPAGTAEEEPAEPEGGGERPPS
jgi:hypothetical protein